MQDRIIELVTGIGVTDVIDIAIIAFVIYKVLGFIRETRAEQLVKGLLLLVLVTILSGLIHLYALNWILNGLMNFGIIALVVVFQPELRRGLERMGRGNIFHGQFSDMQKADIKAAASALTKAVDEFSSHRVGALIILEREVSLNDFAESGAIINSDLSEQVLENLFYVGAPLHDGAVIVRGKKIYAAGVVLPLTRNHDLPMEVGTRHRAGIGVTEVSDAFAIIVSEETGIISTAIDGKLKRFLDVKNLEKEILGVYFSETDQGKKKGLGRIPEYIKNIGKKRDKDAE